MSTANGPWDAATTSALAQELTVHSAAAERFLESVTSPKTFVKVPPAPKRTVQVL